MSDQHVVTLTVAELRGLVRDAVREELARQKLAAPPVEPMLSPREAADLLQVSERHVVGLCQRGELRALRVGRFWRIRREALMEVSDAA